MVGRDLQNGVVFWLIGRGFLWGAYFGGEAGVEEFYGFDEDNDSLEVVSTFFANLFSYAFADTNYVKLFEIRVFLQI